MSSSRLRDPLQFFVNSAYQSLPNKPARYYHSELGYFSIDRDRLFSQDKSQLGVLSLPPSEGCKNLDIDLNVGFEEWRNLPNVQQHLDSLLYWILLNKELMTTAGDFRWDNNRNSEFGSVFTLLCIIIFHFINTQVHGLLHNYSHHAAQRKVWQLYTLLIISLASAYFSLKKGRVNFWNIVINDQTPSRVTGEGRGNNKHGLAHAERSFY